MDTALKIEYWTFPDGSPAGREPEGADEFRTELSRSYAAFVRGRSGDCGGLYSLIVEIASNLTLHDLVAAIVGGAAYDVVKYGGKGFVLKPFIEAFRKLRARNKHNQLEAEVVRFSFLDANVYITSLGRFPAMDNLGLIFRAITEHYEALKDSTDAPPYQIDIPLFDDTECTFGRFRSPLDVDETIFPTSADDYLRYWGVRHSLGAKIRVYDVKRRVLLDSPYQTQGEYWEAWEKDWEKQRSAAEQGTPADRPRPPGPAGG